MTAKPPPGLGKRGAAFWRAVQAEWVPDAAESEVLLEACRLLDQLDRLEAEAQTVTVPGSRGQPRANPALGEIRAGRAQLAQLLASLRLDGSGILSPASAHARHAAQARWHPAILEGGKDAPS
jgi:hypothetical protein